ncbi:hypothetical protein BLOT_010494 [Blomia tropicalis]|nr:hypothetical protein BLOT_010494 [Blomia tropicalis]
MIVNDQWNRCLAHVKEDYVDVIYNEDNKKTLKLVTLEIIADDDQPSRAPRQTPTFLEPE